MVKNTQTIRRQIANCKLKTCKLPTNCLSVFDHFVGLALKGLIKWFHYRYFPGKCPTISENSHKKHFSFEVRNSELQACNVEKKE